MSSAIRVSVGSSVTSPSGYSGGPSGSSLISSSVTTSTWSSVTAETGMMLAQRMPSSSSSEAIFMQVLGHPCGLDQVGLGGQRHQQRAPRQLGDLG